MFQSDDEARRVAAGHGAAHAYSSVRKELLTEFGADFFRSYVDRLRYIAELNGEVVFAAETSFARDRLAERAKDRLEARLRVYHPGFERVVIYTERELPEDLRSEISHAANPSDEPCVAAPSRHQLSYEFETFCVDQTNFRAHAIAQMIASGAGMAFPLTLIYGQPGAGKTHLLNAIKHAINAGDSGRKVLLLWSQEFLEHFQSALHKKRDSSDFKEMVRQPHVLLIDDIQRIFGKKATEEEALATIALAVKEGRQIVLTADTTADGMSGLDERLRRLLKGAMTCEVGEAGPELRRRILEMRVAHYARHTPGFSVAPEALDMIAERLPVSGRELDGAVGQLLLETKITGELHVTTEVAETALQGKLANMAEKRITIQQVQKSVAAHFNMSVDELLARTRQQNIARPRQIAMYLALKLAKRSLPYTGDKFGGFDHTTVMFARNKFEKLYTTDPLVKAELDEIMRRIRRDSQD
ncbi:MAG: DnaA/Hda family protein [Caulobacterales bacterium]